MEAHSMAAHSIAAHRSLRIAWFSDTTDAGGISSYCSKLLLPILAKEHQIELFSESFATTLLGLPNHHYLKAYRCHREQPFDIFFYQLEDGVTARFVRTYLGIMPGITWVHDLFLSDLGAEATHNSPWEHSIEQFYNNSLPFAARSISRHKLWPRAYREAALSPIDLFSSRWALNEFSSMISSRIEAEPGAHRAEYLAIPISCAGIAAPPQHTPLSFAAVCGPDLEGRAHKFLPALKGLGSPWQLTWLIDPAEQSAAEILIREFSVVDQVTLVLRRSPEKWSEILSSSHVAIHLSSTPFGHLGPYLQLALGSGRLAIVSDTFHGEETPNTSAFKITPGIHEYAQILGVFEAIQKTQLHTLTLPAQKMVASENDPEKIALCLSKIFQESAPQMAIIMQRWQELYESAHVALLAEVKELASSSERNDIDVYKELLSQSFLELGWGS